jgi:putative glutamine amidotransferase
MTCSELPVSESGTRIRFGQNETYVDAILRAGGTPVLIPSVPDGRLRPLYDLIDGLLLPGGVDIHPARYGEEIHERCGKITPQRDEVELHLARWAMDEGKPLLAICRGIQVLNVAMGGSLYQDLEAQARGALRHNWFPGFRRDRLSHPVEIAAGARLAAILGTTSLQVNSLHHQAVRRLGERLIAVGRSPDGVVEAVEAGDHPFAMGVQWHPEELVAADPSARRLFDVFVAASQV